MQKYAKTQTQLADALGIARKNLTHHWMKKGEWPEKEDKGWPVGKCLEFMLAYKKATPGVGGRAGPNGDLARQKLALEVDTLQAKLDILLKRYIPLDEYQSDVAELVGYLTDALEEWVGKVGAERRDVELLQWAKSVRDRTRDVLADKLEADA